MNASASSRLILGTAQLGMPYGIANKSGQPGPREVRAIVRAAWDGGVRMFDTAQAYGQSEAVLGEALAALGLSRQAQLLSKLDPCLGLESVRPRQGVLDSLNRLGAQRLHGLLLHRESLLDRWESGLSESLEALVREGLVQSLGVSVYSPEAAHRALRTGGLDLVQGPASLVDRRLERAGVFELAGSQGKAVHVRSVFLQGLLGLKARSLPPGMDGAVPMLKRLAELCRDFSLSRQEAALIYVREAYPQSGVVFGAESAGQVLANLKAWSRPCPQGFMEAVRNSFADLPEEVINPTLWKRS